MTFLRLSAAAVPGSGDPAPPQVRLPAADACSREDLDEVAGHVLRGGCVHLTIAVARRGLLAVARRHGDGRAATDVRDRLADLARMVGPDASRVMVRVQREPGALRRWWDAWEWRRGIGGPGHPRSNECALDTLLVAVKPHPAETTGHRSNRRCEGRPHVRADAGMPLSWDVIDQLHRWVSAGDEAHLMLIVPRSPVSRDPELHLLWERRMTLDVADREREVAQLWPGTPLVRIDVVRVHHTAGRRSMGTSVRSADAMTVRERRTATLQRPEGEVS